MTELELFNNLKTYTKQKTNLHYKGFGIPCNVAQRVI
jgi:hypothetical protein